MPMLPVLASMLLAPGLAPGLAPAIAGATPPPTQIETVVDTMHGDQIADDYRWLEALEAEDTRVEAWTTKQHEYTRSILDNLPGRAQLEERIGQLMTVGAVSPPKMRGDLYFYTERNGRSEPAGAVCPHRPPWRAA